MIFSLLQLKEKERELEVEQKHVRDGQEKMSRLQREVAEKEQQVKQLQAELDSMDRVIKAQVRNISNIINLNCKTVNNYQGTGQATFMTTFTGNWDFHNFLRGSSVWNYLHGFV